MDQGLLMQGIELMLFGMTAVGLFLTLLVLAVTLSASVLSRWFPEPQSAPTPGSLQPPILAPATAPGQPSHEVVAAITTAILHHRSQRR